MVNGRKIRFALVGCGRISKNHLDAVQKLSDDLELVGVCDTDPRALAAATKNYQVPGFGHLNDLLAAGCADVIALTTPSGLHPEQAIAIARAGCHVVSEKPMATSWEKGLEMQRFCELAGVKLFVVHQNRLNSTMQLLKKTIDQGRFGKVYMVNVNVFWTRPQEYYDQAPWRGTWELDGGAFMNQASHYVDLLQWLFGPVETVFSNIATMARKIEAEDTGVMSLKWKSGALGSMSVTMLSYPKNLEGSITILGEKGSAVVGGVAVNEIKLWSFSDRQPEDERIAEASYQTTSVYGFGHLPYYENVVQVLRGNAEAVSSGTAGLQTLELMIAAYRSARSGLPVRLPLER